MLWNDLEMEINICSKCNLERTRMNPIVGRGNKKAHIIMGMWILLFSNLKSSVYTT